MINTSEIAPCRELQPFVRCYSVREFDTNGHDLVKPWYASHEIALHFFMKEKAVHLVENKTGLIVPGTDYGLIGIGTQYNGEMTFNGTYFIYMIIFKPNGFAKLFGLPAYKVNNTILHGDDFNHPGFKLFYEELMYARDTFQLVDISNRYLLGTLLKQKNWLHADYLTSISGRLTAAKAYLNVHQLAHEANMSVRNFERRFVENIGIPPKLYNCIVRFNKAFELKLIRPGMDWTSIAYECNYFDQAHLIKDFKRFAGSTPNNFFSQSPLREERYTSRIEA